MFVISMSCAPRVALVVVTQSVPTQLKNTSPCASDFASGTSVPHRPAEQRSRNCHWWRGFCEVTLPLVPTQEHKRHSFLALLSRLALVSCASAVSAEQLSQCVGFEDLTAVVMNRSVFWDITPYSRLKAIPRFRGTCRLHHLLHVGFLLGLFFDPEYGGDRFFRGWLSADYTTLWPRR
jgi:hypothetical protein